MPIRIPRGWEIPDRLATPESLVFGRRKAFGLGAGACVLRGRSRLGRARLTRVLC